MANTLQFQTKINCLVYKKGFWGIHYYFLLEVMNVAGCDDTCLYSQHLGSIWEPGTEEPL